MSNFEAIKEVINSIPEQKLIIANELHEQKFSHIQELVFYKALSRMTQSKSLVRLTPGIYCKPKNTRFGQIASSEQHIIEYFLGEYMKSGVVIGYRMFNKYNLTTQVSNNIELYSNILNQSINRIKNVTISRLDLKLNDSMIKMIELINVVENLNNIEDLNLSNLKQYFKESVQYYNEEDFYEIVKELKPQKNVLYSLSEILTYHNINHSMNRYFSKLSTYKSVDIKRLYESAS